MTAKDTTLDAIESVLTPVFLDVCKSYDVKPATVAAEKHGSLVWEAIWRDHFRRSVTLAVAFLSATNIGIEIWIAADDGQSYVKRRRAAVDLSLVNDQLDIVLHIREDEEPIAQPLPPMFRDEALKTMSRFLRHSLRDAFSDAALLAEKDLTEGYPFPIH